MKDSGWRFDKIGFMTVYFNKAGEMNGRSYVEIQLRFPSFPNSENIDK